MDGLGFFMCAAVIAFVGYTIGEAAQSRRRNLRRALIDARRKSDDLLFQAGVSGLTDVPLDFVRAFRHAVGRALSVPGDRLEPTDRIRRDLRAVNFDAIELAAVLERAFDVRVKVADVIRASTLRELCKAIYLRSEDISEYEPPLHRDPVPKLAAPEPKVQLDA